MYFICKLTFNLEVKTNNLFSNAFLLLIFVTLRFSPWSNGNIFRFLVCVIFCFVRNVVYVVHKCYKSSVISSVL